jgi:ABC-type branched-subunit amino acid transport system substrate-binding protein
MSLWLFLTGCSLSPHLTIAKSNSDNSSNSKPQAIIEKPPEKKFSGWEAKKVIVLSEAQENHPTVNIKVGLILPLTGPLSSLGDSLFKAAQLAIFDSGDNSVILIPIDSKGTEEGARKAAEKALDEQVEVIIGPLSTLETKAVNEIVRPNHIPILAFTTDRSRAGDGVYVLGLQPGEQIIQGATYASQRGYSKALALLPNNDYGQTVAEDLKNRKELSAFNLRSLLFYDPAQPESQVLMSKKVINFKSDPEKNFDILLLADDGKNIKTFLTLLKNQGLDLRSIRIVGPMLWDNIQGEPLSVDTWYAMPSPEAFTVFNDHFFKAFGHNASRLGALAYDATAIVIKLSYDGSHNFSQEKFMESEGFIGANGLFRFVKGVAERSYAIEKIIEGGVSQQLKSSDHHF